MKELIINGKIIFIISILFILVVATVFSLFNFQYNYRGIFTNISNTNQKSINKGFTDNIDGFIDAKDVSELMEQKQFKNNANDIIIDMITPDLKRLVDINDFKDLKKRMELHTNLWRFLFGQYDTLGYKKYKKLLIENSDFLSQSDIKDLDYDRKILAILHQTLYPWLYHHHFNGLKDIILNSKGKGIVICAGNKHIRMVRSTLDTLRNVIHTKLPIHIFYNGEEDLTKENQEMLQKEFEDVTVQDITIFFDNSIVKIGGWSIKPFGILACPFEEVILIDADAMYIHDPIEFFDEEGYRTTGTLFFRDRTILPGPNEGTRWLKSWMDDPLPETRKLRFWNEQSFHEFESSTVVVHKLRNILGLLGAAKLNEQKMRDDVVYKYVYGDKETFWIGFDLAREHYYQSSIPCGFIGSVREDLNSGERKLCGHIGHALSNGHFIYWNEHIVRDKTNIIGESSLLQFKEYTIDNDHGNWVGNKWECLVIGPINVDEEDQKEKDKEPKIIPLSKEELKTVETIIAREKKYHFVIPESN